MRGWNAHIVWERNALSSHCPSTNASSHRLWTHSSFKVGHCPAGSGNGADGVDNTRRFPFPIDFCPTPAMTTTTRPAAKSWPATEPSQPFKAFPASLCRPSTLTWACKGKTPSTLPPADGLAALLMLGPLPPPALGVGSAPAAALAPWPAVDPSASSAGLFLRNFATCSRTLFWLIVWPSSMSCLCMRLYPKLASADNWRRRSSTATREPFPCVLPASAATPLGGAASRTSSLGSSTRMPGVPSARNLKNGSTMAKLVPSGNQAWASQMFVTRGALYTCKLAN
mmetsp:Transcript_41120/g.113330  ORF Transcript_41120/g.113330 Transcript_41120/m.113330 type:complete len:283 (+) Transcript_41120:2068-2916(+)